MSLFAPDDPWNTSRLFRFLREVNEKHRLELRSYEDLHGWSTAHPDLFWSHVWDHTQIIGSKGAHVVDTKATPAENPGWFSDSAINFAENLLSDRSPDTTAIVQVCTFPSDVWSKLLAMNFFFFRIRVYRTSPLASILACSGTNFPESQARARPSIQRTTLLARGRRSVRVSPVRGCPG